MSDTSHYVRGPVEMNLAIVIALLVGHGHIYHERTLLPVCQLRTWPLNKIIKKTEGGKLFLAEVTF